MDGMVTLSLSFPQSLSLIFLVTLLISTIYSFVLIYHWRAYGESRSVVMQTIIVYLIGLVGLFIGMGAAVNMAI